MKDQTRISTSRTGPSDLSAVELESELKQWADTRCGNCGGPAHSCPAIWIVLCDARDVRAPQRRRPGIRKNQ